MRGIPLFRGGEGGLQDTFSSVYEPDVVLEAILQTLMKVNDCLSTMMTRLKPNLHEADILGIMIGKPIFDSIICKFVMHRPFAQLIELYFDPFM